MIKKRKDKMVPGTHERRKASANRSPILVKGEKAEKFGRMFGMSGKWYDNIAIFGCFEINAKSNS